MPIPHGGLGGLDHPVDGSVLGPVLRELVDNACRHDDSATPGSTSRPPSTRPATTVTVTVTDNGPGIPAHELAPLEAGTETPLDHGSGLGLWLVSWGATALGGRLAFDANEPRGTVATLRLPTGG